MISDATVNVLMPGEPFQELYPCDGVNCVCPAGETCALDALISGQVLVGLGCWCEPFTDTNGNGIPDACEDDSRRHLQENQLYVVPITEEPFAVAVATEEEDTICTGFFLFCWIKAFLAWLISLLTFGLL